MKIIINPLAKLIARAEVLANSSYLPSTQDMAHERKRRLAEQAVGGAVASPEFQEAAAIEGMTTSELAAIVLAKPCALMTRENARRTIIVKLRAAKTKTEIDQILAEGNVQVPNLPPGL